jgi:hypothetical protein
MKIRHEMKLIVLPQPVKNPTLIEPIVKVNNPTPKITVPATNIPVTQKPLPSKKMVGE